MNTNIIHFFMDGTCIDLRKEDLGEISLRSLLTHLGTERRFANSVPWTVLQHSLTVGRAATALSVNESLGRIPNALVQHGYFHDIQEAIIRDVPTPCKEAIGQAWYDMEYSVQRKLFTSLGVPHELDEDAASLLKAIDRTVTSIEFGNYFGGDLFTCPVDEDIRYICSHAFGATLADGELLDRDGCVQDWVHDEFQDALDCTINFQPRF